MHTNVKLDVVFPLTLSLLAFTMLLPDAVSDSHIRNKDFGLVAYEAQQLWEGYGPYVRSFSVKLPLGSIVAVVGILLGKVFGWHDVIGMQLVYLSVAALTCIPMYFLAKQCLGSRVYAVLAALIFVRIFPLADLAFTLQSKLLTVFFELFMLQALVSRRWLLSGVAASLAVLAWQPAAALFLAGLVYILFQGKGAKKSTVWYLLGASLPVAALLIYVLACGDFWLFVECSMLYPLFFHFDYSEKTFGLSFFLKLIQFKKFGAGYAFSLGILAYVCLGINELLAKRNIKDGQNNEGQINEGQEQDTTSPLLFCLLGITLYSCWDFQDYPDFIPMLPFAALGFAALIQAFAKSLEAQAPTPIRAVAPFGVVVPFGAIVPLGALALFVFPLDFRLPNPLHYSRFEQDRTYLQAVVDKHALNQRILTVGTPQIHVLLGTSQPSREVYWSAGRRRYYRFHMESELRKLQNDIQEFDPDLIVLRKASSAEWLPEVGEVRKKYRKISVDRFRKHWTFYKKKSLPKHTGQRLFMSEN